MVSGNTAVVALLASEGFGDVLGALHQPHQGNHKGFAASNGLRCIVDNAAFSRPDPNRFWNYLIDWWGMAGTFEWAACPDVVGDAVATLAAWKAFRCEMECEIGYVPLPLAFVAQDGSERMIDSLPWNEMAGLFVGGTTEWKLGAGARAVVTEARRRSLWVHVGRVNSWVRLLYCRDVLKADSVDGKNWSAFSSGDTLRKVLTRLRRSPEWSLFAA